MLVKDSLRTEDTPSVCNSCQLVWTVMSNQTHMKEGPSLGQIGRCMKRGPALPL